MNSTSQQLQRLLSHLLRPLARILLRKGMGYGELVEAAKLAFVEAAQQDLALPGRKQTTSRISTLTGLSRKEVHRLLNQDDQEQNEPLHKLNRAARVISGWCSDARFTDADGAPIKLRFENAGQNDEVDFTLLVKEYSGDITARTIADELTRTGAIEMDNGGYLHLIRQAYIPAADSLDQFRLMSQSLAELTSTIEHNLNAKEHKFFQRKVFYDSIPQEYAAELKHQVEQIAQTCLEDINRVLVKYDTDHSKIESDSKKVKLGLAMHYFEEHEK